MSHGKDKKLFLHQLSTKSSIDEYATIDGVNNVIKEYTQLTYLDEEYLTKV